MCTLSISISRRVFERMRQTTLTGQASLPNSLKFSFRLKSLEGHLSLFPVSHPSMISTTCRATNTSLLMTEYREFFIDDQRENSFLTTYRSESTSSPRRFSGPFLRHGCLHIRFPVALDLPSYIDDQLVRINFISKVIQSGPSLRHEYPVLGSLRPGTPWSSR